MEAIINTRLRESIRLHDVLHGFHTWRGTGTAILELNLAQEIDSMDQYPLFLFFLDLHKAYNTVDRGRLLTTAVHRQGDDVPLSAENTLLRLQSRTYLRIDYGS